MATPGSTAVLGVKAVKRQLDEAMKSFDEREAMIKSQKAMLEANLNKEFNEILKLIQERKKTLNTQLESITQQKLETLTLRKETVELSRLKLSNLLLEAATRQDSEEISVEFEPHSIQPLVQADTQFLKRNFDNVKQGISALGEMTSIQLGLTNCTANGDGVTYGIANKESIVLVHNAPGKLALTADIVHIATSAVTKCDIAARKDHHSITYTPTSKGKYSLNVRLNSNHIQGSPFSISVLAAPETFLEPSSVIEGLSKPRGVAVNSNGHVIVAEYDSHYVSIVKEDGSKHSFGGFGSDNGKFNKPRGIAVDKDDNIYVTDMGNHRVQKFNTEGKFLARVGTEGSDDGQFNLPLGVCFNNKKDRLFVCDQMNYRVQVFSPNLTFKRSFGSQGNGNGQLNFPESIAFDDANNLYVTDYYNNRIQVFSKDGQFLHAFPSKSTSQSSQPTAKVELKHPRHIAIDGDLVYISEWEKNGFAVFLTNGHFIGHFGDKGDKKIGHVCGLSVDLNGSVIVSRKNKIEVF